MKKCVVSVYTINVCFWYKQKSKIRLITSWSVWNFGSQTGITHQHKIWLSWIICYSESLNVSSLVCQSKSRLPGSYFTGRCKSILHFIMFLVGRRHNCVFFCSLLKAAPLFPSVWPSSEALRLAGAAVRQCRGGPWARCVCSALSRGRTAALSGEGRNGRNYTMR